MTKARLSSGWCRPADVTGVCQEAAALRSRGASIANRARNAKLSPQQRKDATRAANLARWVNASPEQIFAVMSAAAKKRWANWTPEQRAKFNARLSEAAKAWQRSVPPEVRSAGAKRAADARWAKVRAARAAAGGAP